MSNKRKIVTCYFWGTNHNITDIQYNILDIIVKHHNLLLDKDGKFYFVKGKKKTVHKIIKELKRTKESIDYSIIEDYVKINKIRKLTIRSIIKHEIPVNVVYKIDDYNAHKSVTGYMWRDKELLVVDSPDNYAPVYMFPNEITSINIYLGDVVRSGLSLDRIFKV